MLNSYSKRVEWIDACKGLAIILVVFGHCWSREVKVFLWIYSFHLPIFFMLAGYLIATKGTSFSKEIIVRKVKRLLIPYFTFSFLILLMIGTLKILGGMPVRELISGEMKSILGFRANMSTWFLACIFISECIFLFALKQIQMKRYLHISWIVICIAAVFCIETNTGLIFVLRRSLLGVIWMEIGCLIYHFHQRKYRISRFIIAVAFLINIVLCAYNGRVNMMFLEFGKSKVIFLVIGILGSVTVMEIFRNCNKTNRILTYCGKHSLEILCSHTFLIEALRLLDYKLLGNFISSKIIFEGYILTTIVLLLEIPFIWVLNKYFPWSIGKQSKQVIFDNK